MDPRELSFMYIVLARSGTIWRRRKQYQRIQNKACKTIIEEEENSETRSERGDASTCLTTPADQIAGNMLT